MLDSLSWLHSCAHMHMPATRIVAMALCMHAQLLAVSAVDNGEGLLPPMGWRSWNAFSGAVTQKSMVDMMDAMASRKRTVDGVPTWAPELGGRNGFPPTEKNELVLSIETGCADTVPVQPKPNTPF